MENKDEDEDEDSRSAVDAKEEDWRREIALGFTQDFPELLTLCTTRRWLSFRRAGARERRKSEMN